MSGTNEPQTVPPQGQPTPQQPGAGQGQQPQQPGAGGPATPSGSASGAAGQQSQPQQQPQQQPTQQPSQGLVFGGVTVPFSEIEKYLGTLPPEELADIGTVESLVDSKINSAVAANKKRLERQHKRELERLGVATQGQPGAQPQQPQQQLQQQPNPAPGAAASPQQFQVDPNLIKQNQELQNQLNEVNDTFSDFIEDEMKQLPDDVRQNFEDELTDDSTNSLKRYQLLRKLIRQHSKTPPVVKPVGQASNPAGATGAAPSAQPAQPQQPGGQPAPQQQAPGGASFAAGLLAEKKKQEAPEGSDPWARKQ